MGNRSGPGIRCPHCGKWTPSDRDLCSHCGLPLIPSGEETCHNCGEELPKGAKFCPYCGVPLIGPGLQPWIRFLLCASSIIPPFGVWAVGILGKSPNPKDRAAISWVFFLSLTGTALIILLLSFL